MNRATEIIDESRYPFALIVITFVVAAGVTSAVASTLVLRHSDYDSLAGWSRAAAGLG